MPLTPEIKALGNMCKKFGAELGIVILFKPDGDYEGHSYGRDMDDPKNYATNCSIAGMFLDAAMEGVAKLIDASNTLAEGIELD